MMQISHLADQPELANGLMPHVVEHYRYVAPDDTVEARIERLKADCNRDRLPMAWVAHEATQPLGMAALRETDLPCREDLSPWLASVFVHPEHRGRGIATALCRTALEGAQQLGIRRLYLFTPDQQSLYRRLGWRRLEAADWKGHPVEIMTMQLSTT